MKRLLILLIFLSAFSSQAQQSKPLIAYTVKDSVWHFLDHSGKEMFPAKKLIDVRSYSEGFFRVKAIVDNKERWCFMDTTGEIKIVPECHFIGDFHEGMAQTIIYKDAEGKLLKKGFINKKGEQVIPSVFMAAEDFSEGLAYIMYSKQKRAFIDTTGNIAIEMKTVGYKFSEGIAAISNSEYKVGFINRKGDTLVPLVYGEPSEFSEGLAKVNAEGLFGYINSKGDTVIAFSYHFTRPFSEGLAFVGIADRKYQPHWGLINKKGDTLLPFVYEGVKDYSEQVGAVKYKGKWGFVDRFYGPIIEPKFSNVTSFYNKMAWASIWSKKEFGYIDYYGNYILTIPEFKKAVDFRANKEVY